MLRSKVKSTKAGPPLLSILILSLPERTEKYLLPLLRTLQEQIDPWHEYVEVIVLTDNRWRTIGCKRNDCLRLSQGRFITFVDDDDMIAEDYIESILTALLADEDNSAQCVVFDVWVRGYDILGMQTARGSLCRYGIELPHANLPDGSFLRKPNPRMVYRRDLVSKILFLDVNVGEDDVWGREVSALVTSPNYQIRIPKILYFYNWNVVDSEAGGVAETREDLVKQGKIALPSDRIE